MTGTGRRTPASLPRAHATVRSVALAAGFTFLELLVVMGLLAMLMGLTIGWLNNIGRSARSAQAAQIVTESAFRCQNASAGGRRATLELRMRKDAEGVDRLTCFASVQRPVLTANFEPPPKDQPELDWFISAAGSPDWAKPTGEVVLADDEGKTALSVRRGGVVDFGTRSGFAATDGVGVDVLVKPAAGGGTMTLLKCADGPQLLWKVQLVKDTATGPDVYVVQLTTCLVPEDAPAGATSGVGTTFRTAQPCVPAAAWSRLQIAFDGREPSIRVAGVERLRAAARPRGAGTPPPAEPAAQRFTAVPDAVAQITLSASEAPYVGLVDTLEVTGVFRSEEDVRLLRDVSVLRPTLPVRVVYANGRLDPARHSSDVVIDLVSALDESSGSAYEVRFGLYGDIPPPRRVLLSGATPATTGPPTTDVHR